jgi:CRISPR/Cas system CMR subunit Cmr4 (Cas7 group RAMP superfamily)
MGATVIFDPNIILLPVLLVSGLFSLVTGGLLVTRSLFRFRAQVNQSIAMDVELVRVTKKADRPGEQKQAEAWKEEVLVMEKMLEAMA